MWYVCKYFDTHFEECMGKYENNEDAERTAKWFNDGNKSGLVSYEVKFFKDKKITSPNSEYIDIKTSYIHRTLDEVYCFITLNNI